MRTKAAFGLAAALALVSGSAFAAGGVSGKGDNGGGKGGNSPAAGPSGGGASPDTTDTDLRNRRNPDKAASAQEEVKPWEIGAAFETHRMLRQDDLEGAGSRKVFNVYGVFARYDLSEHDSVAIRDYFDQVFVADAGESGIRSSDVSFGYTRTQPLAHQFTFSGSFSVTAPTSFYSQKAGAITAPSLSLQLDKRIGKYVGVSARVNGSALIAKYRTAEGGLPNGKWHLGGAADIEVTMPFHEPLSFGADIATGYSWFYDVQDSGGTVTQNGVVKDGQYPNGQPIQQSYGGEIFAHYSMPTLAGIKSDFRLALAQGDPSLGYTSVLHYGVDYFYVFYRLNSEVYASLTLRY